MIDRLPTISVVIPAYKAEAFIARAVCSVLAQPDVRPEIIVVVDGIYDRTAAIAGEFPGVTVLVNDTNRGASAARNRGLAIASAPFVLFLDADDYLEGPFLKDLLATAESQALDLVFGPACKEWRDGWRNFFRHTSSGNRFEMLHHWITGNVVPDCSVLWRREFLQNLGGWREDLFSMQDIELAWRGILRTPNVAYDTGARGCGVYVQHDGPRVTSQRTTQSFLSILEVHKWIYTELSLKGALDEPIRQALRTQFYKGMCASYLFGIDAVADKFALEWRNLGGTRHEGSFLHRLACAVIGVRLKQRLSASRLGNGLRAALALSGSRRCPNPARESLTPPTHGEGISAAGLPDAR